ncbi:MAG TPA: helix-turn-helix transcriptional regulator [Tardiphaga sp.]
MQRSDADIVDYERLQFGLSNLLEPAFAEAPDSVVQPGAATASRIGLMVDTLGFLDCGWAILDRHLTVLHLNARFREFLGKGLTLADRQLSSIRSVNHEKLTGYFRRVIAGDISTVKADQDFVHLPRRDQLPLIVRAHCVSRASSDADLDALGIVLVTDPEHSPLPKQSLIQLTLGLSHGEARIALALIKGASLVQAAQRLGISHETARTHLKSVFAKTRTNRQSELVVLLNRISRIS